jgi:hypothetical protein
VERLLAQRDLAALRRLGTDPTVRCQETLRAPRTVAAGARLDAEFNLARQAEPHRSTVYAYSQHLDSSALADATTPAAR